MKPHLFRTAMVAGALTLASSIGYAPAVAQDYEPQRVKRSVSVADLRALVAALGHEELRVVEEDRVVIGRNSDGLTYTLFGTACDVGSVPGCQGIMAQVRYDLPESVTPALLAEANLGNAALNVWADNKNKILGVTRYIVIDNGVTMANLKANIEVLLDLAPQAVDTANGEE